MCKFYLYFSVISDGSSDRIPLSLDLPIWEPVHLSLMVTSQKSLLTCITTRCNSINYALPLFAFFDHPSVFAQVPLHFAYAHTTRHPLHGLERELFESSHKALTGPTFCEITSTTVALPWTLVGYHISLIFTLLNFLVHHFVYIDASTLVASFSHLLYLNFGRFSCHVNLGRFSSHVNFGRFSF